MAWLHQFYGDWPEVNTPGKTPYTFIDDVLNSRKFDTWSVERAALEQWVFDAKTENYSALCAAVYRGYMAREQPTAERWGDKNNFHIDYVELLADLFPQAQFIHIVRDVRDVACSYKALSQLDSTSAYAPSLATAPDAIAQEWTSNVGKVQRAFSTMRNEARHTMRYEDLVSDPENTLRGVCAFLGETFHPAMLDFHKQELEPAATMDWKELTKQPITSNRVGRYKQDLSLDETASIEAIAGEQLAHYSYCL